MKRRTSLKTLLAGAGTLAGRKIVRAATPEHPIQLHVDLSVDPAKEQEMLHNSVQVRRYNEARHVAARWEVLNAPSGAFVSKDGVTWGQAASMVLDTHKRRAIVV